MDIIVGNRVRSFDFHYYRELEGDRACYMEGEVTRIVEHPHFGYKCYEIQVDRCVSGGIERDSYPEVIYPPVNGTKTTMGRSTDGVVPLGTTPAFDIIMAS